MAAPLPNPSANVQMDRGPSAGGQHLFGFGAWVLRIAPGLPIAVAIWYAAATYAEQAEADRLQRQCQVYFNILGNSSFEIATGLEQSNGSARTR